MAALVLGLFSKVLIASSLFFPFEDRINRFQMSKVVYKAICWDCFSSLLPLVLRAQLLVQTEESGKEPRNMANQQTVFYHMSFSHLLIGFAAFGAICNIFLDICIYHFSVSLLSMAELFSCLRTLFTGWKRRFKPSKIPSKFFYVF